MSESNEQPAVSASGRSQDSLDYITRLQLVMYPDSETNPRRAEVMAYAEAPLQEAALFAEEVAALERVKGADGDAEEIDISTRVARAMRQDAAGMSHAAGVEYDLFGTSDIGVETILGTDVRDVIDPPNLTES